MTMIKKGIATLLITMLATTAAFADQSAYITKAQAEKAAAFLKDKSEIRHYCAPCDDKGDRTDAITSVEALDAGYRNYWEVKVNGQNIDLAYVYFRTKKGKWKNLAKELGVKVRDVPKYLP